MKSSQNIQRLGHTKCTSCSSDFVLKIKISKFRLSLLISGIICFNLLKNKIFKVKIWSIASENK
jgi:hypothetical protein